MGFVGVGPTHANGVCVLLCFYMQGDDLYLQPFAVGSFGRWFPTGWLEEPGSPDGSDPADVDVRCVPCTRV